MCGQAPGKVKPALASKHDVYQDYLRPELLCSLQRLSRGSDNADDAQALLFQPIAGGLQKQPVVVHDQNTERRHVTSVPASAVPRIEASTNRKGRALSHPPTNQMVSAANGVGYAYSDTGGAGPLPLLLLQHFCGMRRCRCG